MKEDISRLIIETLREPNNAIAYRAGEQLSALYPDLAVIEGQSNAFDLLQYAADGRCEITPRADLYSQVVTEWRGMGRGIDESAGNSWYEVGWNGHKMSVVLLMWIDNYRPRNGIWIVAANKEIAEAFLVDVSEWCSEVRGEIVVFEGGCWHKSKELYRSIQAATFDNLILPAAEKQQIRDDFQHFFSSREEYERFGVPWKRGVLFHGPPGNGKTHTLKALINWLDKPCLYVKSFKPSRYETDHEMIRRVFARARQTTPCLLVLEDLDSIIDNSNRSFFLNELDGFAANTGIVVLATTNHPERLDPAILERPSRFDRKYAFPLPEASERAAYLSLWNERAEPALRLSEDGISALTVATEGFSYAYLKELWLSSMVRWMDTREAGSMDTLMAAQAAHLKEQMATPIAEPAPQTDSPDEVAAFMQMFHAL